MRHFFAVFFLLIIAVSPGFARPFWENDLAVSFAERHGQIEVGGRYVGAAFHHSRPVPSRVSFYEPVANSIDLSTDYWQRDVSLPLQLTLAVDDTTIDLTTMSLPYRYTPGQVLFHDQNALYGLEIGYEFGHDLPLMALRLALTNRSGANRNFVLTSQMATTLRTCHTYAVKNEARLSYMEGGRIALVTFDDAETDSARIFVINRGDAPTSSGSGRDSLMTDPVVQFQYERTLKPDETWYMTQLIGSTSPTKVDSVIAQAKREWRRDLQKNETALLTAVQRAPFTLPDSVVQQTARWSKAVLAANQHYLADHIVPMPCPAEYNFYFTHDMLLTNLGATFFDTERVKRDLDFLRNLSQPDSILPHAYYLERWPISNRILR